jgi:catechol 2,3-dioxygenase-like lactoylglutathione lyase family enzyme
MATCLQSGSSVGAWAGFDAVVGYLGGAAVVDPAACATGSALAAAIVRFVCPTFTPAMARQAAQYPTNLPALAAINRTCGPQGSPRGKSDDAGAQLSGARRALVESGGGGGVAGGAGGPPTLVRRATLLVRDVEASLAIYRDILGLEVIYDEVMPIGGTGLPTGVFNASGRLVFLRSFEDERVGVLALLSYLDKPIPSPPQPRRQLCTGDVVLLLNTVGAAAQMAALAQVPGVRIQSRATVDVYPSVGGGTMRVLGNSWFDPDGHFVELNEVVEARGPAAGEREQASVRIRTEDADAHRKGIVTNRGDRVTAVGDLHGDFEAAVRVLRETGVIAKDDDRHGRNQQRILRNAEKLAQGISEQRYFEELDWGAYRWIYGNNMLVQTGDLFDRGTNSKEIIELFMHLSVQATSALGQVVNMAGNHEFMPYQYRIDSGKMLGYHADVDSMSVGPENSWQANRASNLHPTDGRYGRWLRDLPAVVYETQSRSVFSHGCVTAPWARRGVVAINEAVQAVWAQTVSVGVDGAMRAALHAGRRDDPDWAGASPLNCVVVGSDTQAISDVDGPLWNRFYNNAARAGAFAALEDELRRTVDAFEERHGMAVDRLVSAHTIVSDESDGGRICEFVPEQHPKVWPSVVEPFSRASA